MKHLFIIFFFILVCTASFSQKKMYNFYGTLRIDDGRISPEFRIEFEVHDNKIKGFSYYGEGDKNISQAIVVGEYIGDEISFQEIEIVYPLDKSLNFCLVAFQGKVVTKDGFSSIIGDFTGYLNADKNRFCGGGILMMSTDTILENSSIQPVNEPEKKPEILPGENETVYQFHTQDENISIVLIDTMPDFDRLTMSFDNQEIIYNTIIENSPLNFNINTNDVKFIKITSTSSGKSPPNTSEIILQDSKRTQKLILDLEINETAWIEIVKP